MLSADPYTAAARLCDDDGIVRQGAMHHGTDYPCTGHAHVAGDHYRCTSPAHATQRVVMAFDIARHCCPHGAAVVSPGAAGYTCPVHGWQHLPAGRAPDRCANCGHQPGSLAERVQPQPAVRLGDGLGVLPPWGYRIVGVGA